jgi:radical SAM-linked protein
MKLRVRYAKLGKVRFTSHRDTARIWERAMRKAAIPVATSGGFTPRPRLSLGLALPTGAESTAEYLDAELIDGALVETEALADRLSDALPVGFTVLAIAECSSGTASLQESVTSVTWELTVPDGTDAVATAARLMAADHLALERERKGDRRTDDVRPLIVALEPSADGAAMIAELATIGRGLRPAELAVLAFPDVVATSVRATRTHQWIEHDGTRREVLALPDAVSVPTSGA